MADFNKTNARALISRFFKSNSVCRIRLNRKYSIKIANKFFIIQPPRFDGTTPV
nr:MAG TPA: hypothetical protein [Caudoviricetes sp.]